jgi:signal transduction histidine kinase
MASRRSPILPVIGAVTLVYFVAGKLGLKLAFLNASATAVWPPSGIALAALLLLGYRIWPAIFVGAFLVNLTTTPHLPISLGIATGNTLEAICGAWLVNRFAGGTRAFDRAQDVFKFVLIVVLSSIIAATLGVTSITLGDFASWSQYGPIWLTWWLGDVTGCLIIAPLLLLWFVAPPRQWHRREIIEVVLLLLLLVVLGEIVFGRWSPISAKNYPLTFITGPIVIWTAFRFTQRETATGVFILSAMAVWGTLDKVGPFVRDTENQSLLMMQGWTGSLFITAMALSAAMAERRRAEQLIEEQKVAIESANQTKDNFLAMLSHELRTPLTPIIAAVEALKSESLDSSEAKEALAMIRRNVDLESHLIDDLLDLTRIVADKLQLQFEPVDAHRAINDVVKMCATEVNEKQLRLSLDLSAEHHYVGADPAKFQQIIWNLLKNAIKFTHHSGAIAISSSNPTSQSLTIQVKDTGIGIEPEMMDRIFNRFEQGGHSFQRRFGGLGLGLTISKSFAHAHGATLVAQSDGLDRGSTFLLTIKTVPAREQLPETPQKGESGSRRSLRILLVDDHPDTSSALERLLRLRGHVVTLANDVRSAMETANSCEFDLLISDVGLPDASGLELMSRLRARSNLRGIAISGFGMNGDVEKSKQAGFHEHLLKPVDFETLEAAIERTMSVPS